MVGNIIYDRTLTGPIFMIISVGDCSFLFHLILKWEFNLKNFVVILIFVR